MKLPLLTLSAFGSLGFPLAAAFIALQVFIPTYYAESTGLSLTAVGLVLLIARLCDTVTDPIVGYLSDITPTAMQRRKLFVTLAAPIISVSTYFLFNPPANIGTGYLLAWTIAIYVAGTLAIVPLGAWGAELSSNYHERARINGFRVTFGLCGSLTALLLAVYFAESDSSSLGSTLKAISLLVIITLFLATAWAWVCVPDNKETQIPDNTVREAWKVITQPTPFRQLLGSFFLNAVGNAIPASLFVLFVTHVLGAADKVGALLFLYFVCSALSVPVWVWISKRLGKHQTWTVAILLAAAFFVFTPFLTADDFIWFCLIVAVTGFATGADLVLPAAINGDLIEWDALQTGYKRPGLFFALWGTATKLSFALAIGLAFPLLDVIGFTATGENDANALQGLAVMYGLPCIAFKLTALFCMRGYPITEEVHRSIRQQLGEEEL